uniref:HMG box domain-containing protein n=1 Tax=Panagrolaimus sp. PS1159 TaxID=55785 RepID=A0AC35FA05_9BILA
MAPTKKTAAVTKKAEAPAASKVTKKNASSKSNDDNAAAAAKENNGPPKGALSAYVCFVRENRETILADTTRKGFMKAAGAAWKKVEDKSKWEEMAKEDKQRYENEWAKYNRGQ